MLSSFHMFQFQQQMFYRDARSISIYIRHYFSDAHVMAHRRKPYYVPGIGELSTRTLTCMQHVEWNNRFRGTFQISSSPTLLAEIWSVDVYPFLLDYVPTSHNPS